MAISDNEHPVSLTDISQTHSEQQHTTFGKLRSGRQRNHGNWCMPGELGLAGSPPLWLAVSVWIMKQAQAVTRDDVAHAFRISPRRAADVMTYIVSDRPDTVRIRKEVLRVGSGHRVAHYWVDAVSPVASSQSVPKPPAPEKSAVNREQENKSLAQARRAFLFQRSTTPDEL
ncbi:CaiF/GrlA family transcriptional regulator [Enterobacter kobei]|uniref:CaiF/GrlA family transcriptional regulator n=1 Tax=Enterobacter kobei TaxID=208224 RepID=UPI003CEE7936